MRTVRMNYGISGGRADGTDWPPAGALLDLDDGEAAGLVAGKLADWAERPAEPAAPPPPPGARATRAEWADHAVASGADPAEVEGMTKAQLAERFGASGTE